MGHYANNNLLRGEKVEYEAYLHWKIFVRLSGILTLFIYPLVLRKTSEFVITNMRVIIKKGWISRYTFEMNLNKIETVNVDQSFWGRIFGFGTITIIGTGGTREEAENISKPLEFRRKFMEVSA
ncbi:MAG TPA: PH domain-containing protein [Prolixibacteraceae bacterium]|jgi:uncharacterized membrane protein YdbT with pleckstrin-like domain|nr:PH domain-containing protein [Prolixibacteraceae bacterium]